MPLDSREIRRYDYNENGVLLKRLYVIIFDLAEDWLASGTSTADQRTWAALALKDIGKMAKRMVLSLLRGPLLDGVETEIAAGKPVDEALDDISSNNLKNRVENIATRYKEDV
jgi:hypothetical protein